MQGITWRAWLAMLAMAVLGAGCAGTRTQPERSASATAPASANTAPAALAPAEPPPPVRDDPEPAAAPAIAPSPPPPPPPPKPVAPQVPAAKSAPTADAAAKPAAATTPSKAAPSAAPAPAAAQGAERLSGRIGLSAAAGQQIAATEVASAIVYFIPAQGAPRPKPGRYSIITRAKRFDPEVLVVPAGSTVAFPNQDEILHNVFSLSPGATFDLGLYGEGQSAETVFNRATVVQVFCNVHHSMHADIVVVPTPWFARVGADGSFALDGVPAGPGTLTLWHPRAAAAVTREVTLPLAAPLQETLLAVKPVIPNHQRKDGASYRPPAR